MLLAALAVILVAALVTYMRAGTRQPAPPPVVPSSASATPIVSPAPSPGPSLPPAPALAQLQQEVRRLEVERSVNLGVAIVPIGRAEEATQAPWQSGTLTTTEAWSTMDVPIAIAVLRSDKQPEDLDYLFSRALLEGSSAGDDALWSFLGSDEVAAARTTAVLRDGVDSTTVIPVVSPRAGSSGHTQAIWSASDQARFMAGAYCMPDAWPVLTKLGEMPPDRAWGLSRLPRAQAKGGTGVTVAGNEVVRQLGVVTLADGSKVGVSIIAAALDGTALTATKAVDELADELPKMAIGLGTGHC